MKKGLHLTLDDRCSIANGLNNRYSFKAIANTLEKDCTTISKEVKKHITISQSGCSGRVYNNCVLAPTVSIMYQLEVYLRLSKPNYVCNGCPKKHNLCILE